MSLKHLGLHSEAPTLLPQATAELLNDPSATPEPGYSGVSRLVHCLLRTPCRGWFLTPEKGHPAQSSSMREGARPSLHPWGKGLRAAVPQAS